MDARLQIHGGQVRLDPLNFRAAGGDIDARITMDARRSPMVTVADVQGRGLKLNRLAPNVRALLESAGTLDARTELTMYGNSTAAMFGSANGKLAVAMNGGTISDLALRLADLDVANALVALARGDRAIPIRCFVGDFAAVDGVLQPQTLVLDTAHTIVRGEGTINLRDERLALQLIAKPKDGSLLALRGPIRVDGTLASPVVHPDLGNAWYAAASRSPSRRSHRPRSFSPWCRWARRSRWTASRDPRRESLHSCDEHRVGARGRIPAAACRAAAVTRKRLLLQERGPGEARESRLHDPAQHVVERRRGRQRSAALLVPNLQYALFRELGERCCERFAVPCAIEKRQDLPTE
jgi:hypothetical protein